MARATFTKEQVHQIYDRINLPKTHRHDPGEDAADPFQDDDSNSGGGNQDNQGNSGNQGNDAPANEQPAAQAPADSGDTAAATESAQEDDSLPRTGLPAGPLVVIGVILLLGGGFALRRVWPRPH